jgi:MFS transporter, putative metabolite:H+ symporter
MNSTDNSHISFRVKMLILVAALGYFVDVYDLILFSIVRVASLQDLGFTGDELLSKGVYLINMQMFGMLIGGVLWGVIGDRFGRISVLFGSILLYSVSNIANGFVSTVDEYAFWRFLAGIGLAGELGAGITLVSEIMPQNKRGYGTTIVATVGVMGAVVAAVTSEFMSWRTNYFVGGGLGLILLLLRVAVSESSMFQKIKSEDVKRGSLVLLFSTWERSFRYLYCTLSGLPVWFVAGIMLTFAPEMARALGVVEPVTASMAVFYIYIGLMVGDLCSGLLSQMFQSRKKVIIAYLIFSCIVTAIFLNMHGMSAQTYALMCLPLGFSVGYWAMFVTVAAEQFGTNLRATVATSVPNFVRGAAVIITSLFQALIPSIGHVSAAGYVAALCMLLAFIAIGRLKDSFHTHLDFIEK